METVAQIHRALELNSLCESSLFITCYKDTLVPAGNGTRGILRARAISNATATLIPGSSTTADIEMTRIQGVNEPLVLDCVIDA